MEARQSRLGPCMPIAAGILLLLVLLAGTVLAPPAKAGFYQMVRCAANTGANGYVVETNTASPQNPGGIFDFPNNCGPGPFPAGDQAWLRINENQAAGNAGNGAFGRASWTVSPFVAIRAAGGYTRQPNAFNDGWRARFWAEGADGSAPHNILMQGSGVSGGGIFWGTTSTFGSHLWPFPTYGYYRRFVYELACVRSAGCDRANFNATDANTFILTLSDESNSHVAFNGATPFMNGWWVSGHQASTYAWSEFGSGIAFEALAVDNVDKFAVDYIAAGQCNRDFWGGVGEFARDFQVCPTIPNVDRSITLNTAEFTDGAHQMRVCTQDYGQRIGVAGTGGYSCDSRVIYTDNTPPGAPAGLEVMSANPARYLDNFGAHWSLPPNSGSPIVNIHYNVINAAGDVVVPQQTVSGTNLSVLPTIAGPEKTGDYRLKVWLEDAVGFQGPASTTPIPRDTTPPAAPQSISVAAPDKSRTAEGFDLKWRNIVDTGSPISAMHYEVLSADGRSVVPRKTVAGQNVETVSDLETPAEGGQYTLRMWLSDAEGNQGAAVAVPLSYECVRSETKAGDALSSGMGAQESQTEVVHEGTGSTVRGTLRAADGRGIGPVPVCIFSRVVTDQQREFIGLAITAADGTYKFPVQPGASRELIAVHRRDHRELVSRASIQTIVHPTLKARKKVIYNKHAVRFFGEIPGPHNDRVVVVLQAKVGKGWSAFRRYRTRGDGKFSASYRFRRTFQKRKYVMRAQVRETVGYPYLQGNSKRLQLLVLPKKPKK
jgi:hypothetical protein